MPTSRVILASGCFWGAQELFRSLPGVVSTRVGYSGDDDTPNATYRNHGDHAEALEVIYDPGPPPSFGPVAVRVVGFRLMGALPSVVDGCEVAER